METAILVLIASLLGGGVTGGLLAAWGQARRTLALKTRVDAMEIAHELFKGQLVAEIKRRAGAEGLSQRARNKEIEELARSLPAQKSSPQPTFEPAWWETEGVKRGS